MNKPFNFLLTLKKEKILSVNALYLAGLKKIGGKNIPYIYKNPKSAAIENEIREQLKAIDFTDWMDFFSKTKYFSITISFILKANVMRRDVQNLDKHLIDVITKYIHDDLGISSFDDSLFLDVYFTKSIIPKSSSEYVAVQIRESKHNLRFDVIDVPENIYLPDPDLKKGFKKIAKEECMEVKFYSKVEEKEKCNTEIEFLNPENNLNTLGEDFVRITEQIGYIKSCENRFYWVGVYGDEKDWGESNYKILNSWVYSLSNRNQDCSRIRIKFISNPEEILKP